MFNSYYVRGGDTTCTNTVNIDAVSGSIAAVAIDSFFITCEVGDCNFENLMGFDPYVKIEDKVTYDKHYARHCTFKKIPVRIVQSMILPNNKVMFEIVKAEDLKKEPF